MTELLCVPLKKSSDIDVSKPLKHLIASTFSTADNPVNLNDNLSEFQKLRQAAIRSAERGEAAITAIANYYDQIASLVQKIPPEEVQIAFKWRNAFDKGSIFGSRISLTLNSLSYEKVCVLFNLGAINSVVAGEHSKDTEDGLQKSLKKLQLASGIFHYLRENVGSFVPTDATPDLEPEALAVLSDLMLAQAQEMIVLKAIQGQMKDNVIAKLCAQCEELFANVMKSMQKENVRNIWDQSWLPNVCGKQAIYNGLAQYHQSRVCNASKAIGEEISRLEYAKTLFSAGIERGGNGDLCNCKDWLRKADRFLTDAKKDNDFIYHERIPDIKSLPVVAKAVVAKATIPLPNTLGSANAKDLFESLCPVAVHQALAAFDVRKQEIVNTEVVKLKDATNTMNELLSSMNLPAAIEDTSGSSVPGSLVSKANSVKEAGGMAALNKLIADLPDLLTRNTEILDECERMLKEEADSDTQLRNQFKEKWNRTPSATLTGTFKANAQKYRTIITNAKQADGVVKEKLETHKKGIEILSSGGENLKSAIPSTGGQAIKGSPTVTKLRSQMEDVETIKAEREVIESELKTSTIDMKSVFFDALNKNGIIAEPDLSAESLSRVYGPLQTQVTESKNRQDKLMSEIRENHEAFVRESGGASGAGIAREEMLKSLAAAHDAFFELKGNLQEGTKFYNDLTQLLVTFQNKVSDFTFARKTEKEELMKDLTSGMAQMQLENTPKPPTHHATAPATQQPAATEPERPPRKSDAPARPPQPAVNPYAGAPTTSAPTAAAPAPPAANPYAGAPAGAPNPYGATPYPPTYQFQYTPMPTGFNPYAAPQPAPYPQAAYPPQYPPYAGYPPQPGYPPQQPGAPGYPPYPQQPPQGGQYPPQQQ